MTSDTVTFRAATESDAGPLAAVIRAAFAELDGKLDPPAGGITETSEAVARKLQSATCLVAEEAGEIIGCVFFQTHEDHLYLFRLAVHPAHRGKHLGIALTRRVEEEARRLGLDRVKLSTRYQPNIDYYERLGYALAGEEDHPEYPGVSNPVLFRDLKNANRAE